MNFAGKWVFHSIGTVNEKDEVVFMTADEYISSPMPYVDESDSDAVAEEINERKLVVGSQLAICDDGKLYTLMPIPEGATDEDVKEAVEAGEIKLYDGMLTDEPKNWEDRNGELWVEVGMDMSEDGWANMPYEDGLVTFATVRYTKA